MNEAPTKTSIKIAAAIATLARHDLLSQAMGLFNYTAPLWELSRNRRRWRGAELSTDLNADASINSAGTAHGNSGDRLIVLNADDRACLAADETPELDNGRVQVANVEKFGPASIFYAEAAFISALASFVVLSAKCRDPVFSN